MNKKQLFKVIIFFILFVFFLQCLTYMLRTNGEVKDRFTGFYAEKKNTIDAIMIGSSPVHPYYAAPQIWGEHGIASYPLSTNQQRPKAAIHLIEEAEKTQNPSLYIFEMRQYTYEDDTMLENTAHMRGVTDNLKNSVNRIKTINDLVDDKAERYTYYFDIFKYHQNYKSLILKEQWMSIFYERKNPLKGFLMHDGVTVNEKADFSEITETQSIPKEQETELNRLLVYIKENELQALFIVSPRPLDIDMQKKFNYIEQLVTAQGYPFLDMNQYYDEIGLDFATDFYDDGHTNVLGAEKCTAYLGEYLQENYEFTDKRGDEQYESWDISYETFLKEAEATKQVIYKQLKTR